MNKRVLALDGGGIKGTYTAAVLAEIEAMTGKRIAHHFDLVTGTSTGGIIAVALGLGVPAERILTLYVEQGPTLFPIPKRGRWAALTGLWKHICRPKHSQENLAAAIKDVIQDRKLGESTVRLVIPAFDGVRGNIQLFKTAHTEHYKQDYLLPALTVAIGTAAAPTYYPAYGDPTGCFLDGGVWANCPVVVGLLEATCILGWNIDEVELLSIGTTTQPYHVSETRRNGGAAAWNVGLIELLTHSQCEAALGQARLMTKGRMLRIDATTSRDRFSLDDAKGIADLRALGIQSAREHEREISRRFLSEPAVPFVPHYLVKAAPPVLIDRGV
jgi:patatin-like phospholipase/acyl hydrolase